MTRAAGDPLVVVERLLASHAGLRVDPVLRGRLRAAVEAAAAAAGEPFESYCRALPADRDALEDLLDRVTVQESAFFRDPGQFAALERHVLPSVPGPAVVWSAGCGNGQEAYSVAMLLAERPAGGRVLATDLAQSAVTRTLAGRYSAREIAGVPPDRLGAHLRLGTDGWTVAPAVRSSVDVRRHNLVADPLPVAPRSVDVVLCRNVLIYLRRPDVVRVLDRLGEALRRDGWLFLGYSESLWHVTDRFRLERVGQGFAYRPADAQVGGTRPAAPLPDGVRARDVAARVRVLMEGGEAAIAAGDHRAASAAFSEAAALDPEHAIVHFHLGLALDAVGRPDAARDAYETCRRLLRRAGHATVETALEGFRVHELMDVLDARVRGGS